MRPLINMTMSTLVENHNLSYLIINASTIFLLMFSLQFSDAPLTPEMFCYYHVERRRKRACQKSW